MIKDSCLGASDSNTKGAQLLLVSSLAFKHYRASGTQKQDLDEMDALLVNNFERRFEQLIAAGEALPVAVENTAFSYLDTKPIRNGKPLTRAERHAAFWSSSFLTDLPAPAWFAT